MKTDNDTETGKGKKFDKKEIEKLRKMKQDKIDRNEIIKK